jgi:hypothetical protein
MVAGKVTSRKIPWWKKIGQSMIADDAQNVGDYILTDVFIPAIKTLIVNIVEAGTNRVLFGGSIHRRTSLGFGARSLRNTPYDRLSTDRDRYYAGGDRRPMTREARARHDFDEVVLESRSEAIEVVETLADRIDRYRAATVADLYDLVGVTGSFADQRWGWTDLSTADVRQVRGGFLLDLPQPEPIR